MSTSNKEDIKQRIEQHRFTFKYPINHNKAQDTIQNVIQQQIEKTWIHIKMQNQRSIPIKHLIQSNKEIKHMNIQDLTDEEIKKHLTEFFVKRMVDYICHLVKDKNADMLKHFTITDWNLYLDGEVITQWSFEGDSNVFPPYRPYFTKSKDSETYDHMMIEICNYLNNSLLSKTALQYYQHHYKLINDHCSRISIAINAILRDQAIGVNFHTSEESENNPPNNKNNEINAVSFLYTDKKNDICKLYKVSFTEEKEIQIQLIPFDIKEKVTLLSTDEEKQHFKELFFSYSKDKPPFMENIEHEFNNEQREFFNKIKVALDIEQIQNKHTKNDANNNSLNTKDDKKDKNFLNSENNQRNERINDAGNQSGNIPYVNKEPIIEYNSDKTENGNSPPCTLCGHNISCLDCCHLFSGKQQ